LRNVFIQHNCDGAVDLEKAENTLNELRNLSRDACDTLKCRIEAGLEKVASVELCALPEEAVSVDVFLAAVEANCTDAAAALTKSV